MNMGTPAMQFFQRCSFVLKNVKKLLSLSFLEKILTALLSMLFLFIYFVYSLKINELNQSSEAEVYFFPLNSC